MSYDIEVFFDGDCPLCIREINMLRWLDKKNKIKFTDIAGPDFAYHRDSGEEFAPASVYPDVEQLVKNARGTSGQRGSTSSSTTDGGPTKFRSLVTLSVESNPLSASRQQIPP